MPATRSKKQGKGHLHHMLSYNKTLWTLFTLKIYQKEIHSIQRQTAVPVRLSFTGVFRVPVALELLLQSNSQPLNKKLDLVRLQLVPPFHKPLQEEYHSCNFSPHISQIVLTDPVRKWSLVRWATLQLQVFNDEHFYAVMLDRESMKTNKLLCGSRIRMWKFIKIFSYNEFQMTTFYFSYCGKLHLELHLEPCRIQNKTQGFRSLFLHHPWSINTQYVCGIREPTKILVVLVTLASFNNISSVHVCAVRWMDKA